jgi:DNA primase
VISEGRALVVEGPLDAVLLWQIGQQNVVATGTARMTDAQAQILARYTQRLDVMFDSDDSGREAFDRLRRERGGLFLSVDRKLVPPPFKDPADWVRAQIDRRIAAG